MHPLQITVLKKLAFSQGLHFSELQPKGTPSNQLTFHLQQLMDNGLVMKEESVYHLTGLGKEKVTGIDSETLQFSTQAKQISSVICMRQGAKEMEFLFYERTKHPYFGFHGFPAGKIKYGETVGEAASREVYEETGLFTSPELLSITHYITYDKESQRLVDDKVLFRFRAIEPKGDLVSSAEGECTWIPESEIRSFVKKPYHSIELVLEEIEEAKVFNGSVAFREFRMEREGF